MLGLSSTPEPFLENIGRELDESYRRTADRWRQNAAVRIEAAGGREELVLTGLDGLEDPPSLVELRTLTERMLPQVDLPELLLEVNAWTGFADAFTHVSETRSRIPDLPTSVCAALIADACNIALEPLVRKDTPALTRGRLSWIKQNYFRAETLIQANAALVDCQMTIPLAQTLGRRRGRLGRRASLRRTGPNPQRRAEPSVLWNRPRRHLLQLHERPVHRVSRHRRPRDDPRLALRSRWPARARNEPRSPGDRDGHGRLQRSHLWAVLTAGVSVQPQARRPRPHAVLAYQSPHGIRAAEQSCTESHQPQTHPKSLG